MISKARDCRGIALPMVLILTMIVIVIAMTILLVARNQEKLGTWHANQETAKYVAEVGIYQYLWHMNQEQTTYLADQNLQYYEGGNDSMLIQGDGNSGSNIVLKDSMSGKKLGAFHLTVQPPGANPNVIITSTGWLAVDSDDPNNPVHMPKNSDGTVNAMKTFTVQAEVHKKEFTQYIEFLGNCKYWDGSSWQNASIGEGYVEDGPYHSNHSIYISGSCEFTDVVEYGNQPGDKVNGGVPSDYDKNGQPKAVPALTFPPSNSKIQAWADLDHTDYTGRTSIWLHVKSGVGVYDVTYWDNSTTDPVTGLPKVPGFYTYTNLTLPPHKVIYVSSLPGTPADRKWDYRNGNVFVSGTLKGQLTIAAAQDIYVTTQNPLLRFNSTSPAQTYTVGIAYDNTNINGGSTDMLGLLGDDVNILEWGWPTYTSPYYTRNPGSYNGTTDANPTSNPVSRGNITIYASILAHDYRNWSDSNGNTLKVQYGAYQVEDINHKAPGTGRYSHIYGSKIQDFGGITNDSSSGYAEDNHYDSRLLYSTPPHFLEPANAGWGVVNWQVLPNPPA